MNWTFTLPIDLPSKNGVPSNRHARARLRNGWAHRLENAAREVGIPLASKQPAPRGVDPVCVRVPRRHVTIIRMMAAKQRPYDTGDGLQGGASLFRDAMQVTRYRWRKGVAMPIGVVPGAGIVWDDSAAWSEWAYEQRRAPDGKAFVVVEVRDVGEEQER